MGFRDKRTISRTNANDPTYEQMEFGCG